MTKPTYYITTGHADFLLPSAKDRRYQVVKAKPLSSGRSLDLPQVCDICQRRRNKGNHQRCSKLRQALRRRTS